MELNVSINLGNSNTNLTLNAQIVDVNGNNVGPAIISGFTEIGNGYYFWTHEVLDTYRGGIKFFDMDDTSTVLAFLALDQLDGQNLYFAQIRYISDVVNNQDEFVVHWFKNDQLISSGDLTNPRLSVCNTIDGSFIEESVSMNYISSSLGIVRYDLSPRTLTQGEPYLIKTSGIIDGMYRTWNNIVGIDLT
jgi:hypothetical protein